MRADEILDMIDNLTHPDKMTKPEALEFLQEIQAQLVGRIEGFENEIAEEEATPADQIQTMHNEAVKRIHPMARKPAF
jgi:hypothetical protein